MAKKRLTSLPDGLWTKLEELDSHIRRLDLLRGIGWTFAVAACSVGLGVLADICFDLSTSLRIGLLGAAGLATLWAFFSKLWRPFRSQRSMVELASTVEHANPKLNESLVSCIELYDSSIPESERGSELMRELAARHALNQAAAIDFSRSVSPRPARRMAIASFIAWSLLLLPLIVPSSYRLLLCRYFSPWLNYDRVVSFWFDVENGDRVIGRGSDVSITVLPRGDITDLPRTVTMFWVDAQGESDSRQLDLDTSGTTGNQIADVKSPRYTTTIPHVMQGFEYSLSGGGNRSRRYRVRVVDVPEIAGFQLEIQPPAYTGLPAKVMDGPVGDIAVFAGSQLTWHLQFNKPAKSAELVWLNELTQAGVKSQTAANVPALAPSVDNAAGRQMENSPEVVVLTTSEDGLSAKFESLADQEGYFRFVIRDEFDLTNETELSRHLVITLDQAPVLKLSNPVSNIAQSGDVIPVEVHATDDIGLAALELHVEVDQTRKEVVPCSSLKTGQNEIRYTFSMPLSMLHLKQGELVNYRVRAADGRIIPGPNETWSERFVIRVDSMAKPPGTQELVAEHAQLKEQLKKLRQDTAQNEQQITKLHDQATADAMSPTDRSPDDIAVDQDELERVGDLQTQLQARLEQLAAQLTQHPLFANLTAKAEQLAAEEFAKASESLNQAEAAPVGKAAPALDSAKQQLKQADIKLADLEQQFEQIAKLERDLLDLNRLAANAEHLADRLRDLDARKQQPIPATETPMEKVRREQIRDAEEKQLLAQQKDLAKKAEELLERQPQLQKSAVQNQRNQLAQLIQQAQELAQPQRQIAQNVESAASKNEKLIEKQQQLQSQAEKLKAQLETSVPLQPSEGTPESEVSPAPIDLKKLEDALAALKAGNPRAAAAKDAELVKQLGELEQNLRAPMPDQQKTPAEIAQSNPQSPDSKRPTNPQNSADEKSPETTPENNTNRPSDAAQDAQQNAKNRQAIADQTGKLAEAARELTQDLEQAEKAQDPGAQKQQQQIAKSLADLNQQLQETQERLDQLSPDPAVETGAKPGESKPGESKSTDAKSSSGETKNAANQIPKQNSSTPEQKDSTAGAKARPSELQETLQQAQQAMDEALSQLEQGNLKESAKSGKLAADALDQLSQDNSRPGPKSDSNSSPGQHPESQQPNVQDEGPIPAAAANQVTDALEQLSQPSPTPNAPPSSKSNGQSESPMGPPGQSERPESGKTEPVEMRPGHPKGNTPGSSPSTPPSSESSQMETGKKSDSPGSGTPGKGQSTSPLTSAAKHLQQAARALKQAAGQVQKPSPGTGDSASNVGGQPSSSGGKTGAPGQVRSAEPMGDAVPSAEDRQPATAQGFGPDAEFSIAETDKQLLRLKRRMAGRKWGELPGTLQTEILQASQKKPNSEYGELIRQYFKEIAKTQPVTPLK